MAQKNVLRTASALILPDTYLAIATIRRFEERCVELKAQRLIQGSMHLCSGQEAIPVGACAALEARDALTDLDPQHYRPKGELERALEREPLARLRRRLGPETAEELDREAARRFEAAAASVGCRSRLVVAHEANLTGGFGAEIGARAAKECFWALDAPIERVALPDTRIPAAPVLQQALVPGADSIVTALRRVAWA